MKPSALRDLTDDELDKKHEELEKQLLNLRFKLGTKQIENPMKIRDVRRDIARVLTIMRERQGQGETSHG